MPLKIRTAELTDVSEVSRLVRSLSYYYIKDHDYSLPDWFTDTLTYEAFTERFDSDKFANFVYEKSGNIHGYLAIEKPNKIYHLFVTEAVHSRGVGSQLWAHAKEVLSLDEEPIITLRASLTAVPFYQKLGFITVGDVDERDGICYQPMELIRDKEAAAI